LILSHRGSFEVFCSKIALVDKVLLGKMASISYMKTKLVLIIEMTAVFLISCLMSLYDTNVGRVGFLSIVRVSGCILGISIGSIILVQYIIFVWILKNRFGKLNAQLSALLVRDYDEESLKIFASVVDHSNINHADAVFPPSEYVRLIKPGPLTLSVSKIRNQQFHHDRYHVRALRQTHGILCDVIRMMNSDYGIQVLLITLFVFVSFVMFTFVAMGAQHDPSLADCGEELSCAQVMTNFSVSCACIIKIMIIAVSCHVTNSEASRTSTVVHKLLSQWRMRDNALAELQLFSQQLWNIDPKFTAFGFFTLNLNLLCSMAGTATTYIVILLQLK
jgi:hypothetical protein